MAEISREMLLDAVAAHVPFDGWGEAALDAAAADLGLQAAVARSLLPGGAADLAAAYHRLGDARFAASMKEADLTGSRYSEKVAAAVLMRIEAAGERDVVRRSVALMALPQHAVLGASLIWGTADAIWNALGDTSRDANWYSKRAILAGVYGSAVLFWLGDQSEGQAETRAFVERRIADVMRFEKFKAKLRDDPIAGRLLKGPAALMARVRAPATSRRDDLPGHWPPSEGADP